MNSNNLIIAEFQTFVYISIYVWQKTRYSHPSSQYICCHLSKYNPTVATNRKFSARGYSGPLPANPGAGYAGSTRNLSWISLHSHTPKPTLPPFDPKRIAHQQNGAPLKCMCGSPQCFVWPVLTKCCMYGERALYYLWRSPPSPGVI